MSADTTSSTSTVILAISEAALAKILEIRVAEDAPDTLGLRVEITGSHGVDYTYDLSFEAVAEAAADDVIYPVGDLSVIVPADSVEHLTGATLDAPSTPGQGGLVIKNPNRPDPLAGLDLELEGTVAEKVQTMLDKSINPSLAARRRLRDAGRCRRGHRERVRHDGRWLPGLFDEHGHAHRGHPGRDQRSDPRGRRGHRRHRPQRRLEPLLPVARLGADTGRAVRRRRPAARLGFRSVQTVSRGIHARHHLVRGLRALQPSPARTYRRHPRVRRWAWHAGGRRLRRGHHLDGGGGRPKRSRSLPPELAPQRLLFATANPAYLDKTNADGDSCRAGSPRERSCVRPQRCGAIRGGGPASRERRPRADPGRVQ